MNSITGKPRLHSVGRIILALVLVPLVPIVLFFLLLGPGIVYDWYYEPSDAWLEKNFYTHEEDFNRLIAMSEEDAHVRVIYNPYPTMNCTAASALSKSRWVDYRQRFKKLGVIGSLHRAPSISYIIYLSVYGTGSLLGGTQTGYAYSSRELSPLVESMDDPLPPKEERVYGENLSYTSYRKLKDNWYLYYRVFD